MGKVAGPAGKCLPDWMSDGENGHLMLDPVNRGDPDLELFGRGIDGTAIR